MEEPQPTPGRVPGKLIPDPNTDFGDEAFDTTPMSKGRFGGFNEWVFGMMRPKKKLAGQKEPGFFSRLLFPMPAKKYMGPPFTQNVESAVAFQQPIVGAGTGLDTSPGRYAVDPNVVFNPHNNLNEPVTIPKGFAVENGLLMREKSLIERVAMQLRNPFLTRSSTTIIRGLALAAFAVGALMIYAEIPTHPDIVIGLLLCTIAGNVLISNRG